MINSVRVLAAVGALTILGAVGACDKETPKDEKKADNSAESGETEEPTKEEQSEEEPDTSTAESGEESDASVEVDPALLDPGKLEGEAPETFRVKFETTKGAFVGEFHREWAPRGVDRFYNLVELGYYEDIAFFRVIDGFMAQFGLHGQPEVNEAWSEATIEDDPVEKSNKKGYITFAKRKQPNSRTTQLFVNYRDNQKLDDRGFAPIGKVVEGMDVVEQLHAGYEEEVSQGKLKEQGNSYLEENFPELDYLKSAEIVDRE